MKKWHYPCVFFSFSGLQVRFRAFLFSPHRTKGRLESQGSCHILKCQWWEMGAFVWLRHVAAAKTKNRQSEKAHVTWLWSLNISFLSVVTAPGAESGHCSMSHNCAVFVLFILF